MNGLWRKFEKVRAPARALRILLREEFSFQIQTILGATIILTAFALQLARVELFIVILLIGAVLTVEALNTALEELCDHVTPEKHYRIGRVKDIGSSASAIIGLTAVIIGLGIFIPHFLEFV